MIKNIQKLRKLHSKNKEIRSLQIAAPPDTTREICLCDEKGVVQIRQVKKDISTFRENVETTNIFLYNRKPRISPSINPSLSTPYCIIREDSSPIVKKMYYMRDEKKRLFLVYESYHRGILSLRAFMLIKRMKSIFFTSIYISVDFSKLCDFNRIPAYSLYHTNQVVFSATHYNELSEIHCEDGPAVIYYDTNGFVSYDAYIQHNHYYREGNYPSVLHYGLDGVQEIHFWKHRYGEPPPASVIVLTDVDGVHDCSICLDQNDLGFVQTTCDHIFHKSCLNDWFAKQKNCPICRRNFN